MNGAGPQQDGVIWEVPEQVTADDRRDIIELARRLGIEQPRAVKAELGGCLSVGIESRRVVEEGRVTWVRGAARRAQGPGCSPPSAEVPILSEGDWLTGLSTAVPHEAWRIQDGEWFVDLFSEGVDFETAARVVRIARSERLVERCSEESGSAVAYGADDISAVLPRSVVPGGRRAASRESRIAASRGGWGGGVVAYVRVSAGEVILVGCSVVDN